MIIPTELEIFWQDFVKALLLVIPTELEIFWQDLGAKALLLVISTEVEILWQCFVSKGQLISECPFDALNVPKNQQKIWQISALEYKNWSNHKIKPH